MRALRLSCLLLLACGSPKPTAAIPVATAQGTSLGAPLRVLVTVDGGTLASADGGLRLLIPAGALTRDTTLTLEPITRTAPGGRGEAWRLGPEGTVFSVPATLRFEAPSFTTPGLLPALGVGSQDSKGYWRWLRAVTRDEVSGSLSVSTTHLSDWSVLEGVQLRPLSATVKEGQTQALELVDCVSPTVSDDGLADLMSNCEGTLAPLFPVTDWSVNGQAGGNSTVGTVHGTSNVDATYTAPGQAPDPPTVSVSATLPAGLERYSKAIVFSQLTIGTPGNMHGSFTMKALPITTGGSLVELSGDFALTLSDDGLDETNYKMSGTVTMKTKNFVFGELSCVLKPGEETKAISKQGLFKVRKLPVLAVRWGYSEGFFYECTNDPNPWLVMIYFFTGTGPGCTTFSDVPITKATAPSGTYSSNCGYGETSATWTVSAGP